MKAHASSAFSACEKRGRERRNAAGAASASAMILVSVDAASNPTYWLQAPPFCCRTKTQSAARAKRRIQKIGRTSVMYQIVNALAKSSGGEDLQRYVPSRRSRRRALAVTAT